MNGDAGEHRGLRPGRLWGALPAGKDPIEWSMDPRGSFIQGPLDCEFLRGQRIFLVLAPGQLALLIDGNNLKAVFLDGGHHLEIGTARRQISPRCGLVFLAADRALALRWTKQAPLRVPGADELEVIGRCTLRIDAPAAFHRSFLASRQDWSDETVGRAADALVRTALGDLLNDMIRVGGGSTVEIQSRLAAVQGADIAEQLADSGLTCTDLAVYTATPPVETGPAETAGQFSALRHN